MQDLLNTVRQEAERVGDERAATRHAIVDGYRPYEARVRFQPDDTLSGWLPIATLRAGNGAGIYAPPNIGDQVVVDFQEAGHEAGIVRGSLYSEADKPLLVPAGEVWVVLEGGATVKLQPGGVTLSMGGVSLVISGSGVAITGGTLTHNGVNVGATHRHTGVQTGAGQTGVAVP